MDSLTIDQFTTWQAYYRLEPWDLDNHIAPVSATMFANAHRGKDQPVVNVSEFMPPECRAEERAVLRMMEDIKRGS